ncbi:MAG: cobalamin-binding protein [Candidatus Eisenbacteria bacterium]|nr:cobalamin-binding protein [Candidatus Eisenbacteria bacterium]
MRRVRGTRTDRFGLVRPQLDAHTLGITSVAQLLRDCGYHVIVADATASEAFGFPEDPARGAVIEHWLLDNQIDVLCFSYRLNPADGAALVSRLVGELKRRRLFAVDGGAVKALHFAGLPETCRMVRERNPEVGGIFVGDETPAETLRMLGIETEILPKDLLKGMAYDEDRLSFGKELIEKGEYLAVRPIDRSGCGGYGTGADRLESRIQYGIDHRMPPLTRAHVGPYLPDRAEAVRLFLQWTRELAASGLLDVLSIGTSQLTQSNFGEDWGDKPNGGGVPLNSKEEFAAVWQAARPMLVRSYAGTKNIVSLARMYEEAISIAWHALSLWWFCRIDGRGPYSVRENLEEHFETLRYIASTGKPFEPNVPHHFAFRGSDDVTYIVSAFVAAKVAKSLGVRLLVLQNMLNTPKYTWGVQDLAKSRAMLQLVRELEDDGFRVVLQPRGGLDYFSHDLDRAKAQLAAATALMDDIEPHNTNSPAIIHVVSFSEASHLADPPTVNESIQITRHALEAYRKLRRKGEIDDMSLHPEVLSRTAELVSDARVVIEAIESSIRNPYTPEGLYRILSSGFLPIPYLWECKEEFHRAAEWQTRLIRGSVKVVDEHGIPISASDRMRFVTKSERSIPEEYS